MQNAFAPKFSSKEIDMLLTLMKIKCLRLEICDLNLDYLEVSTFKYQRQFKQICIKYQFLQPYTEDFVHIEQVTLQSKAHSTVYEISFWYVHIMQ